jgi:anti-anti-sigma factor
MNPTARPEDHPLTVRVSGDLLNTTTAAVRAEIDPLLAAASHVLETGTTLRLDLTAATMIDSVGLNLVVSLLKAVQKRGAKLQIAYADQNILRTLTFTRLDKQIELVKV